MKQMSFFDYDGFVEKFKPKKTTDDCYTPPAVYDAVLDYIDRHVRPLEGVEVVRPFWPGEDYQRRNYPPGCMVIDNPPFSICAQIVDFYLLNRVDFFLFCNGLTATNHISNRRKNLAIHLIGEQITFENGAVVNIAFVTNVRPNHERIVLAGDLTGALYDLRDDKRKELVKWVDPPQLVSAAKLKKYVNRSGWVSLDEDCVICIKNEGVFGGGAVVPIEWIKERERERKVSAQTRVAMRLVNERYNSREEK